MDATNTAPARTALLPFDACECSHAGCQCAATPCPANVLVRRDGVVMTVCGNCELSSDIDVAAAARSVEVLA